MSEFPTLPNEEERLKALRSYNILDTMTEQDFDDLTELASVICGVPIALISLVDSDRQWFKSHKGLAVSETAKTESFCAHAIAAPNDIMVVEDAHEDERFKNNELVTGDLNLTFYAGVPLVDRDGFALGSLCVIDHEKRQLTDAQAKALRIVSRQVMERLEQRREHAALQASEAINRKISEQVNVALADLTATENDLQLAVAGANLGQWILELPSHKLTVSDGYKKQFGLEGTEEMTMEDAMNYIEPAYYTLISDMLENAQEPPYTLSVEFAIRQKTTGERRWIRGLGKTERDADGKPTRILGMNIDFTVQKEYEETIQNLNEELQATVEEVRSTNEELGLVNEEYQTTQDNLMVANAILHQSEEKLRLAIESSGLGTWYIDTETREFTASIRTKELFGFKRSEEMTYDAAVSLIREDYRQTVLDAKDKAITEGGTFDVEYPIVSRYNGRLRWVHATGKVYAGADRKTSTFFGTLDDITERKQDELRKNDFIAMVSHEMKAPLAVVLNSMQVIEMTDTKVEPVVGQMADMAIKQVRKMTSLINGFLNMSRIDSGKIHLEKQSFRLYPVIEQLTTEFSLANPNFSFRFDACRDAEVVADKDKIGNVVSNFLSNAVKYSPAQTTISVTCRMEPGGGVRVGVTDEGQGIPVAAQEKLFDRFYRVDTINSKTIAGFGIGLYLCAEIVGAHGGQIGVESEVGKGSTFWFTLPTMV